jgi:hypothetical protein
VNVHLTPLRKGVHGGNLVSPMLNDPAFAEAMGERLDELYRAGTSEREEIRA